MALNPTVCGDAIAAALKTLRASFKASYLAGNKIPFEDMDQQIWETTITVLFAHIEANMIVASAGPDAQGGVVLSSSTSIT